MASVWHISEWDLTLRILISAALGGLIGLEREWSNHAAGLRTHILVCIGATVIMLLSAYGFTAFVEEANVRMDPARLAAQVVSGIGFLGAGAILRTGSTISGLTTAASIWVVAAIGLCVGAGFLFTSVLATVIVLVSLFLLNKIETQMLRHRRHHEVMVKIVDKPGVTSAIFAELEQEKIQVVHVKFSSEKELKQDQPAVTITEMKLNVKTRNQKGLSRAIEQITAMDQVLCTKTGFLKVTGDSRDMRLDKENALEQ
ncbi:MgtC/SapB family protein [Paenibacillus pinihumi]|uniref:MgtC/SapB family protein n=1 Tax=Paenibacillus pinihumi TaxID=669462 RepID=UPI00041ACFAF|nr:MgtC/SapB family protein [Paenibacillus pinihumi]